MMAPNVKSIFSKLSLLAMIVGSVQAQVDYDAIKTPKDAKWLEGIDMSSVPNLPVRAVGSGVCPESTCDGVDNDLCFESCGNTPADDDIYGCPQDHQWALSFDDGPSNYTIELLDYLDKEGIKATFCVMGAHVAKYPEILKRAYDSGHQIASHTFSHPHLMSLTNEEIIYEVKATEQEIQKAIGVKPRYIRPPFGEADARVKGLLRTLGYKVLLWNVDPTDYDVYMLRNVSKIIQGSFKMAAAGNDTGLNLHEDPGFISLQHDLYKQSVAQVPKVIDYLKNKGYKFFTAAACNNDDNPHTDDSKVNSASVNSAPVNSASVNTIAPPNIANNDAVSQASVPSPVMVNNKSDSSASIGTSSNTGYIMSLAVLMLSVTVLF